VARVSCLTKSHEDCAAGLRAHWFDTCDWVPNNPRHPVLQYNNAVRAVPGDGAAAATAFEAMFRLNGWPPKWRNGIYSFHHYHSNAHEALGVAAGDARVRLGGPLGVAVTLTAGDCLVLPAGTGHCLLEASPELLVVGAYPPGQDWDLRRDALSKAELTAMSALAVPASDPVTGRTGAFISLWI
jgi:uncharacterized protein YjlB